MIMSEQKNEVKAISTEKYIGEFTSFDVKTMQETLAKDCNPAQFKLFLNTAVHAGLNPLLGHIHPVVYNGQMSLQISVEGIIHLARKHADFKGYTVQVIGENEIDEFKAGMDDSGNFKVLQHIIKFPRGRAVGCYATVNREGYKPYTEFMDRTEVEHLEKGRNPLWKTFFNDMFKKHVLKRALKAQFGIEISEETQYEGQQELPQQRRDITPNEEPRKTISTDAGEMDEEQLRLSLLENIDNLADGNGMSFEEMNALSIEKFGVMPEKLNLQQLGGLKTFVSYWTKPEEKPKQELETIEQSEENEPTVDPLQERIERAEKKAQEETINFDQMELM